MDTPGLKSSQAKLMMWHKIKELKSNGLNKTQIGRELDLHRDTVRKYDRMSLDEFLESQTYQRIYPHKLDGYEIYVKESLERSPYLSASQIHDRLRENYPDFPEVNSKTVFNFVQHMRLKYNIPKSEADPRPFSKLPETPPGEYAQVDFGEYWMHRGDGRRVKVYFYVMVMSYSRRKHVFMSRTPFTAAMAVYAHQLSFVFFGGKPRKILYDQDKVLISRENLGDVILTKTFQAFVMSEHFECVFCHKSDPQSKGKVENAVKFVKMNFLRGRLFETMEKLQEDCLKWLDRTANGRPHSSTKRIPDEAFRDEQPFLKPYYGTPAHPAEGMVERLVRKDNTISFNSHYYSVPVGTHICDNTRVWVNVRDDCIDIYSEDTGKQIASHRISLIPGEAALNEAHSLPKTPNRKELENYIMSYLEGSAIVNKWLSGLYESKPRYYRENISLINRELENYDSDKLQTAFEMCLDRGLYNAGELLALCDRLGGRIPKQAHASSIKELLPETLLSGPDRTDINNYKSIFE